MRTSVPGVYAAGESVDGFYRQVIVSAGSGAMAAISLTKDLETAASEAGSK
jgi:thioredoxin reductase (NADPH)